MKTRKTIALVAHDHMKRDLIEWVEFNHALLVEHDLVCTGTTGRLIEQALEHKYKENQHFPFNIQKLKSGPLGGDQQLGAMIAERKIDIVIFFWDPMEAQPHDVDVKALLRIASVYNVPMAINRSSADYIISSPLLSADYTPIDKNYSQYLNRSVQL